MVEKIEQAEASITNEEWHKQVVEAKSLLLGADWAILITQGYLGAVDRFSKALSKISFG